MLFPSQEDDISIYLGLKKMRIFKNKIIFLYFFLRPMRPGGIIEVPQIWLSLRPPIFNSRIYTDFFAACAAEDKRVTQMTQMTQIFSTYPQMRPIRSDDADFLHFLRFPL